MTQAAAARAVRLALTTWWHYEAGKRTPTDLAAESVIRRMDEYNAARGSPVAGGTGA